MKDLQVRNRQRDRRVDSRHLRSLTVALLDELLDLREYELGIHLVSAPFMSQMNERFLQHSGATDVITFDLRPAGAPRIAGEIYICVAVAEQQAAEFKSTWQSEIARYVTHGVLHLLGYDDLTPGKRKVMKREENRLLRLLAKLRNFTALSKD